jgi:hypothetical protein
VVAPAGGHPGPGRIAPGRPSARLDTDLGAACAYLGDVDGNGVEDLAVGAPDDSTLGKLDGALWILLLDRDGKLLRAVEISKGTSALPRIGDFQCFGRAVAPLGDLDRDGVPDVAVGASWGNDAARASGGVWVLFLDRAGGVKRSVELGAQEALRAAGVGAGATIGRSLACVGDVDGDGFPELAMSQVPSSKDDPFIPWREGLSVLIASLGKDGEVRWARAFNERRDGFTPDGYPTFGDALAGLGDVNGDGVPDLAVGNPSDNDGGSSRGAVWIVTLAADGSPQRSQKISDWEGGFEGMLRDGEQLGRALAAPRDLDGNGVPDLVACGTTGVWALFLDSDGMVKRHTGWTVHPQDFGLRSVGVSAACGSPTAGELRSVPLTLGGKVDGKGTAEDGALWLLRLSQDGSLSSQ